MVDHELTQRHLIPSVPSRSLRHGHQQSKVGGQHEQIASGESIPCFLSRLHAYLYALYN